MNLYHYTTLDNFFSIWESKALWFSNCKNTNDFFEREKTYVIGQRSFAYKGKELDRTCLIGLVKHIGEELDRYRQVSFCLNYSQKMPGYASPMMWGQYARSKKGEKLWQDGVCIALDSEKIVRPSDLFFERKVEYSENVKPPYVRGIDITREEAAGRFVMKNMLQLFFTKHRHWEHEREYRFVSKTAKEIGIADAIIGIYVLYTDDDTLDKIEQVVRDDKIIYLVQKVGMESLNLSAENLREIRDMKEMMRKMKEGLI
jgi:hypothetical protein